MEQKNRRCHIFERKHNDDNLYAYNTYRSRVVSVEKLTFATQKRLWRLLINDASFVQAIPLPLVQYRIKKKYVSKKNVSSMFLMSDQGDHVLPRMIFGVSNKQQI